MGMANPNGGVRQQSKRPGRVVPFGKYLLLDRIAVGGMAEVYMSKSFGIEGFEKILAIKRILPTMAEDGDFIEMFIDEAKIAGQLNHANIAPIYELGKIGESHYIAMEYVWGKDLLQIMNRFRRMRKRMPGYMVAWIASKMCEALDYAHHKTDRSGTPLNIIHRDVSPQNVLVSYEGEVKLIDFGIAKATTRTTQTQAGVLKGKFGYMSPEQVRGLPVDFRSDLFAVGTCMYEMLTSDRLFTGESDFSTLEKVRNAAVLPVNEVAREVSTPLNDIVMKALQRDAADRWQSAAELHEALQRFLSTQRPPFGTSRLAAWLKTAFAAEMADEKEGMDAFANVGRPLAGSLRRHAAVNDEEPPESGEGPAVAVDVTRELSASELLPEVDVEGEATLLAPSPFEGVDGPISEEPTQIFFSAEDREEEVFPSPSGAPVATFRPGASEPSPPPVSGSPTPLLPPTPPVPSASFPISGAPGKTALTTARLAVLVGAAAVLMLGLGFGVAFLLFGGESVGTVEIRTTPEVGATVTIDSVPRGRAPLRVQRIATGDRVIRVTADGYVTETRRVNVIPESTTLLEIALRAEASADPPPRTDEEEERGSDALGAEARAEEAPGQSSPEEPTMRARSARDRAEARREARAAARQQAREARRQQQAEARRAAAERREQAAENAGSNAAMNEDQAVETGFGTLRINTIPWSTVLIDGRDTGHRTPVMSLRVRAGRHRVGLRTSDGRTHTVTVTVPVGETIAVSHEFR